MNRRGRPPQAGRPLGDAAAAALKAHPWGPGRFWLDYVIRRALGLPAP